MSLSLELVQRKSLEARVQAGEADRGCRAGDPFGSGELAFKLVHMRDAGLDERQAWLELLHPAFDAGFRYCEFDSFIFAAHRGEFDVALVHGLDWRRLAGAFSANLALLRNRVTIAFMNESTPSRRAALLRVGYDDVFDLRMGVSEARARIRRHVLRLSVARNQSALDALGISAWPKGLNPALAPVIERAATRFTPRERVLFGCLLGGYQRIVSYSTLLRACETRELKDGIKSLRVAMSGLRSKLEGMFKIEAHTHEGYQLKLVDGRFTEFLVRPGAETDPSDEARIGATLPCARSGSDRTAGRAA